MTLPSGTPLYQVGTRSNEGDCVLDVYAFERTLYERKGATFTSALHLDRHAAAGAAAGRPGGCGCP